MKTNWKPIDGHPMHLVSDNGQVFSKISDRNLCQQIGTDGYLRVKLDGKNLAVHRLVASAFIPNPQKKRTVNHKNGIKTDNRLSNLEWATHTENIVHSYNELNRTRPQSAKGGLNVKARRPAKYSLDGEFIQSWPSVVESTIGTGFTKAGVSAACTGRISKYKGFKWKYV